MNFLIVAAGSFAGGFIFGIWLLGWCITRDPLGFCSELLKSMDLKDRPKDQ